jgi:hypothetical protein
MGIIYCGPYADAIGYENHEGYAARVLPDGSDTGTSYFGQVFTGHRAACSCGWRGATHPATEDGEEAAEAEFVREHQQPLIDAEVGRHTVPATAIVAVIRELRERAESLPTTATGQWRTDYARALLATAYDLEGLLDECAEHEDSRRREPKGR